MACANCHAKSPEVTLKSCAQCKNTSYCSRECQKADWKSHKMVCGKQAGNPPRGLDQPIRQPFTRLDSGTWLHDRPEIDVYRLLIDVFRMRIEDAYVIEHINTEDTIMAGASHSLPGFRKFMKLFDQHRELLPQWWSPEHQAKCEKLGMTTTQGNWHDLRHAVEKKDIIEHYGDPQFPMQLRLFAESLYGKGVGGSNGTSVLQLMKKIENGLDMKVTQMSV